MVQLNKKNGGVFVIKIFLSPSNETKNIGAYKAYNTNECEQAERIASAIAKYLDDYECEVMIGERADNMNARITKAKEWGEDVHIPIHTNAFNDASVWGVETFYHSSDTKGKELATALLNAIGELIGKKRRAKVRDNLIETNTPTCTRAFIECDFHTNPERAKFIVENVDKFGEVIANTLIDFYQISKKPQPVALYDVTIEGLTIQEVEALKNNYPLAKVSKITTEETPVESMEKIEPAQEIKRGDQIMLTKDATVYGKTYGFSNWVYDSVLYVLSVNGNRIVFSRRLNGAVTGAVNRDNVLLL